jgi:hypothetical protein
MQELKVSFKSSIYIAGGNEMKIGELFAAGFEENVESFRISRLRPQK